jgi:hypothetical protein
MFLIYVWAKPSQPCSNRLTYLNGIQLRQTRGGQPPKIRDMREIDTCPIQARGTIQRLPSTNIRVSRRRRISRPELQTLVHVPITSRRRNNNAVILMGDPEESRRVSGTSGKGRVQEPGKSRVTGPRLAKGEDG